MITSHAARLAPASSLTASVSASSVSSASASVSSVSASVSSASASTSASSLTSLSGLVPARDRSLPVEPALTGLFPDAGLRRGQVVGCGGVASRSLALAVVARAVADGAWLAVVGMPTFGVEAAIEYGVAPERVVLIDADGVDQWADRVAAAADGFDLVLTAAPRGAERRVRKVRQRLQARGVVMVVVPSGGEIEIGCDAELRVTSAIWHGIGSGHGRLMARRVTIESTGRRIPRPLRAECWLPSTDGRIDVVSSGALDPGVEGTAREAESVTRRRAG